MVTFVAFYNCKAYSQTFGNAGTTAHFANKVEPPIVSPHFSSKIISRGGEEPSYGLKMSLAYGNNKLMNIPSTEGPYKSCKYL